MIIHGIIHAVRGMQEYIPQMEKGNIGSVVLPDLFFTRTELIESTEKVKSSCTA